MADEMNKAGFSEDQPQASEEPKTAGENSTEGQAASEAEDQKIVLTEKELRSRIDREVTKALKTRTANLQAELRRKQEELEELQRKLEESDLTTQAKLELR